MTLALIIVALVFGALTLARIGAARRVDLIRRWPSVVLALAAMFALMRGQIGFAAGLAGAAALSWLLTPKPIPARQRQRPYADPADAQARAILGVGANATSAEIRAAYRAKITSAHPDLGGSHAEAARLTAARDRLLKK